MLVVVYFGVDLGFCGFWWLGLSGLVCVVYLVLELCGFWWGFLGLCWAGV